MIIIIALLGLIILIMLLKSIARFEQNTAKDFSNLFGQGARDRRLRNLELQKLEREAKEAKHAKKLAKQGKQVFATKRWWL